MCSDISGVRAQNRHDMNYFVEVCKLQNVVITLQVLVVLHRGQNMYSS
jgi:hypothetical protein